LKGGWRGRVLLCSLIWSWIDRPLCQIETLPHSNGGAVYSPNILTFLSLYTFLPMKMEQIGCSETSAYKIQTPGYYPEENIQHTEHDESLKLGITNTCSFLKVTLKYGLVVYESWSITHEVPITYAIIFVRLLRKTR
jgi:hypothetical protein